MALLPSFFALQSGGKYLSITDNIPESSLPSGFLKFDEEQIWSPRVKFAVEPAESGDGGLVHIRSCYNNKYLVTKQIDNNFWIVASSKKPEEDQSKASCTLFEPHSLLEDNTSVRLRHVQTQISATHSSIPGGDTHQGVLVSSNGSAFQAIDLKTRIILPTGVSFKSANLKDHYLCSRELDPRWPYQRFETELDIGDPLVSKELIPTADGNYRIKDLHFGKFWRRSPNWIWGDADEDDKSNDTLFSVVKISENVIALRNLGNNYFCGAVTKEGKTNCLNANYPTLSRQTRLIIEETVLERKISGIKYRLSDSRIYAERIKECDHSFATNDSPNKKSNINLNYSITDSKTASWSNTVSIKFGGKITFEVSEVPLIATTKIELSAEVGYTHVWGGSVVDTFKRESTYNVVVPPLTTMKMTMTCTQAAYDVPFSYAQTDLLPSGKWVTTIKDDGIFTGQNSYNFYYQSEVVPKH